MPSPPASDGPAHADEATIAGFCRYFLRLGALGFGGPVALAGYMQRDLVEERGWIGPQEYRDGLAIAQMAPGPLAAQLAMWLAFVRTGVRGATLATLAFIAPPFLLVVGIGWFYVAFGGARWVGSLFYGIAPAAIAIIAVAAYRLLPLTVGRDPLLWVVAAYARSSLGSVPPPSGRSWPPQSSSARRRSGTERRWRSGWRHWRCCWPSGTGDRGGSSGSRSRLSSSAQGSPACSCGADERRAHHVARSCGSGWISRASASGSTAPRDRALLLRALTWPSSSTGRTAAMMPTKRINVGRSSGRVSHLLETDAASDDHPAPPQQVASRFVSPPHARRHARLRRRSR